MVNKKAQSKAGIAGTRRGQQMGDERSNNAGQEAAQSDTPALSGRRRKEANKFFADESAQAVGGSFAAPSSTSPSTPAALPTNVRKGEPGGERVFKERQARKKKSVKKG